MSHGLRDKIILSELMISTFTRAVLEQTEQLKSRRERVNEVKSRIEEFKSLKQEVDSDLMAVHFKLNDLKTKFRALFQHGLFTRAEHEYLKCLDLRYQELEELFKTDAEFWQQCLENAKKKRSNHQSFAHAIEQQKLSLQQKLSKLQSQTEQVESTGKATAENQQSCAVQLPKLLPGQKFKFTLKKLPLWGLRIDYAYNFEWPDQQLLDQMPADVYMKSIEFKDHGGCVSAIKCNLSNGLTSGFFKGKNSSHKNHEIINFDERKHIAAVGAYEYLNCRVSYNLRIRFFDRYENELYTYNPHGRKEKCTIHRIAENEDLIGVYGVKNTQQHLTAFGFFVRVREIV